jgi:AraC family transcriptional regulator of arabinose operon
MLHERLAYLALEEIMVLLAHQSGREQGHAALDPRVEEVRRLLLLNMQDQHTIPLLAERVRLSPSRLAHLFKEQTGHSIMEMLVQIRLRHGARQLEYTSRPIAEVAEDVGFQSPFYFTKQFTAAYGMSPSAYRKEAQGKHADSDKLRI